MSTARLDFGVVDAHQHFWDLERNRIPWLTEEPPVAGRHGDYRSIRRTYMPDEYRGALGSVPVTHSVYVETEWDPADPVGETRWVEGVAREHGLPSAVVAAAWLDREDVGEVLAAHARHPLVRGIRNKPAQAQHPHAPAPGPRGSMSDVRWRDGYAMLARHGFTFDLQVASWHLTEAAVLARDFPDTVLVLDHTGLPADRSVAGLAAWRAAMEVLAAESNTVCKISGLGQQGVRWGPDAYRGVVREAIAIFGTDRCMFGSNYPVERLYAGLDAIFEGFAAMVADLEPGVIRKLFRDNALRIYRIEPGD